MTALTTTDDMIFALAEKFAVIASREKWAFDLYAHYTWLAQKLERPGFRRVKEMNMTQNEALLEHFKKGRTITPLEAVGVYGIFRLASRVFDLRSLGHDIVTTTKIDPRGKMYAEYSLRS